MDAGRRPERPLERGGRPERPSERGSGPLEDVIRTAASVVTGHLAPREAVTILATLVPQAVRAAPRCRDEDAGRATGYASVLRSLAAEVAPAGSGPDRRSVAHDLAGVAGALEG